MQQRNAFLSILLILSLVAVVGGCKKPPETTPEPVVEPAPPPPPPPPPPPVVPKETFPTEPIVEAPTTSELIRDLMKKGAVKTIYFAYDSSELTDAARTTLQANAGVLKKHAQINVAIEGHCDERGTIEYNLALGERRAASVRDYLTSLGLARNRMRVITYGEERPVDPGHSESAWSKNRRAAFVLEQ